MSELGWQAKYEEAQRETARLKEHVQKLINEKKELRAKNAALEQEVDELRFTTVTTICRSTSPAREPKASPEKPASFKAPQLVASGSSGKTPQPASGLASTTTHIPKAEGSKRQLFDFVEIPRAAWVERVRSSATPAPSRKRGRSPEPTPLVNGKRTKVRAKSRSMSPLSDLTEVESEDEDTKGGDDMADVEVQGPSADIPEVPAGTPAKDGNATRPPPPSDKVAKTATQPVSTSDSNPTSKASVVVPPNRQIKTASTQVTKTVPQPESTSETNLTGKAPVAAPPAKQTDTTSSANALAVTLKASLASFRVNPKPDLIPFPRKFFTDEYGSQGATLLASIKVETPAPSNNYNGKNLAFGKTVDMMFPTPDFNPHTPNEPGKPGLMFSSRTDFLKQVRALFVMDTSVKKKKVWLYMGHYRFWADGEIKGRSFWAQPAKIQENWCKKILRSGSWNRYTVLRGIVALHKRGRDVSAVSDEDIRAAANDTLWKKGSKEHNGLVMSDVANAFNSGKIGIDIVKMECVRYDHKFADLLATDFKEHIPKAKVEGSQAVKAKTVRNLSTAGSPSPFIGAQRVGTRERRPTARTLGDGADTDMAELEDDGSDFEA